MAILGAAYSNSFHNSFHFDDSHVVQRNLYIRSLTNIPLFFRDAATFSSLPLNATYRPLVTTTLALDYWMAGGLHEPQFHRTQFALLLALGAMLAVFFNDLLAVAPRWWNRYAALVAATLYCVHTTATETMNLIHARSELLSAIGVVGSFLLYIHVGRSRPWHLYLLPMVVGALAKSQSVIFAPLFVAYLWVGEEQRPIRDLFVRRSWPAIRAVALKSLPSLVVGVLVFLFVESMNAPTATMAGGNRYHYFLTQLFVWLHYARLFIVPAGLTADTDWGLITNWYDTRVVAGFLFTALLARIVWVSSENPQFRPVAFGIAWFAIALLPASSIVPLAEVTNEHRVFLPYIGLSLAAVAAAARWAEREASRARRVAGPVVCAAAVVAIGGNAVGTYERNKIWRTEETLWRDVAEKSPANGRGLMNYGLSQMARGRYVEAKQLFDRALVYNPAYGVLEVNLGIVTDRLGQRAEAERHFARALQLSPGEPLAHYYYARWLSDQGRTLDAIPALQRAVELSPALIDARYALLDLYARTGRTEALRALAQETRALVPGDPKIAAILDARGDVSPAVVTSASVESVDTLIDRSLMLYQAGDFQGSLKASRKALTLKPDSAEAYNNIAASYASLKQWDEAIQAAQQAIRLRPDFPLARNNLAWAESEKRKGSEQPK